MAVRNEIWIAALMALAAFSVTAMADLSKAVTGTEAQVSDDAAYTPAANRARNAGGNVVFLSDLHLPTVVGADGRLAFDTHAVEYQRLESIKTFLRANRGKVTQIVWMGDLIDAKGPKAIVERIQLMESLVGSVGDAAALPVGKAATSDAANHLFLMGNHDVPAIPELYDRADAEYKRKMAEYQTAHTKWIADGLGRMPVPPDPLDRDQFDDPQDTKRVLESWRKMGFVVTERPGDVRAVLLKGFDRPELGRRNKVLLSHYPVGVGGHLQVIPSTDGRTRQKLATAENDVRLGGDDVFARIFGDIHTPRRIEEPLVELRDGRLVRKQTVDEKDRTYLVVDPGTLSEIRGNGTNADGKSVKLDASFGLFSPTDGFFHYRVSETAVEPYALPSSQRSFGVPTGPINESPLKARLFDRGYGAVKEAPTRYPLTVVRAPLRACTTDLAAFAG